MTWLFHEVIVFHIIKSPSHNLTRPSLDAFRPCGLLSGWDPSAKVIACATRVMCAKEFSSHCKYEILVFGDD